MHSLGRINPLTPVQSLTVPLAEAGAQVYAFEPNKHAYEALSKNTEKYKNVVLLKKAVGTEEKIIKLFYHVRSDENPVLWSTGSSVMETKSGISFVGHHYQ